MSTLFNPKRTKQLRSHLRTGLKYSPIERKLWSILRNRQINGYKFRRQHGIGPYFTDFYCDSAKLVIEIDGPSHEGHEEYDKDRDNYLSHQGFTVIHFTNQEILQNIEGVVEKIKQLLVNNTSS